MNDEDRDILDLSRREFRSPQAHAEAVGSVLGMSITRYFQELNRLVDDPEALAYSPTVVKRLRRARRRRNT
ncbi:DUF3263 domain-containing protein [Gordonia sp. (in: high G+C Gram-positive bacteria)]|uniref:DUF3263 domain-containing protein n=1 Tax=Gordonia sp. (in: high G+C Gram-positive bacteria) TaxID=84139 RepID=UPI003F9877C3